MNQQKQYTYFASTKPLNVSADSLEDLAKKLGLTKVTIGRMIMNKKKTSFDNFLEIRREKKEKVEAVPANPKKVMVVKKDKPVKKNI